MACNICPGVRTYGQSCDGLGSPFSVPLILVANRTSRNVTCFAFDNITSPRSLHLKPESASFTVLHTDGQSMALPAIEVSQLAMGHLSLYALARPDVQGFEVFALLWTPEAGGYEVVAAPRVYQQDAATGQLKAVTASPYFSLELDDVRASPELSGWQWTSTGDVRCRSSASKDPRQSDLENWLLQ